MALEGLLVPAVTLFSDAGALDGPRNSKYVRGLLDDGIRHILTLGRPGESTLLTPAERETLVERVVESVTFGSEVWAGNGGGSTEESVAQADSAEAAGAADLVVRAPAGTPPAGSVLSEHFRTLRAQTKLPLVAYNVPLEVGYPLPPIVVHELGRDGTLQGLLDGGDDARARAAYREGAPEGLALFGDEADLGPGGPSTGLHGVCLESANVLPRLVVKFLELAK